MMGFFAYPLNPSLTKHGMPKTTAAVICMSCQALSNVRGPPNVARMRRYSGAKLLHAQQPSATFYVYPVYTSRRVMEHGGALGSRVAGGQPFEGVIHDVVGV